MLASERHLTVTWLCSLVTMATEMAGFAMPGWLVLTVPGAGAGWYRRENYAVWYLTRCYYQNHAPSMSTGRTCTTGSYVEIRRRVHYTMDMKFTFRTILEWELEVTGALVASILACILLTRLRSANRKARHVTAAPPLPTQPSRMTFAMPAAFLFTSCMLYTIPVVRFAQVHHSLSRIASLHDHDTGIPYGLLVAALASLLAFGTLFSLCSILVCSRRTTHTEAGHQLTQCEGQAIPLIMRVPGSVTSDPGYASPLPPPYMSHVFDEARYMMEDSAQCDRNQQDQGDGISSRQQDVQSLSNSEANYIKNNEFDLRNETL